MGRSRRIGYEGVVVTAPVTVPYVRYSTHGAHWFVGRALAALVSEAGIVKDDIDGLVVSSFTLSPDTAVGVTQHMGMSPRWLDHVPLGGASAVVSLRRAARAVQVGDADIVACVGADTNHVDSFRQSLGSFSLFARDATWPYGTGGPNSVFAFVTAHYMRTASATREDTTPEKLRDRLEKAGRLDDLLEDLRQRAALDLIVEHATAIAPEPAVAGDEATPEAGDA